MKEFNYGELRNDLIEYFGTAVAVGLSTAIIDLSFVEECSEEQLIRVAINNGFNLNNYKKSKIR